MYLTAFIIVRTRSAASLGRERASETDWICLSQSDDLRLVVVALGAYPVEQLATGAKVEYEVQVMRGL